jgi:hypothetical protein
MKTRHNLRTYLFQPFRYFAGSASLITGLLVLVLLVVNGFFTYTYFDGVLDVHYGCQDTTLSFTKHLYLVFVSRIITIAVFYITSLIVSSSKIRLIDLTGTLITAQYPLLFAPLAGFIPCMRMMCEFSINDLNIEVMTAFFQEHIVGLLFALLIMLLLLSWTITLMYNAYSVSANVKGGRGIGSFIVAIFVAEIISKISLFFIL